MSRNQYTSSDLRSSSLSPTELQRMKQCLEEADMDHMGMSLQEIIQSFDAINSSRDFPVTVDSDSEKSEPHMSARSRTVSDGAGSNETGDMQWLSKAKGTPQGNKPKFHYRIPKKSAASIITPLNALNEKVEHNFTTLTKCSASTSILTSTTIKPQATTTRSTDNYNEFAALDNGDPRDFPFIIKRPFPRPKKEISAEMAANTAPPPYNDPKNAKLPFWERYEIIGQYMRDMNAYLVRISRASKKKAPWGKPVRSSAHFSGTLDKIPSRGTLASQSSIENVDQVCEPTKEVVMEEDAIEHSPTSSSAAMFDEDPFYSIEQEPTGFDADELQTNPRTQRKRKVIRGRADSLSSNSSSIDAFEVSTSVDPDYHEDDVKRRKKQETGARPASKVLTITDQQANIVVVDSLYAADAYADVINNRPEIAVSVGRGRGKGAARARGRQVKNNAEIMARSRLFKDTNPVVGKRMGGEAGKVVLRSRRMLDLSQAEEARKAEEVKSWNRLNECISPSMASTDVDIAQISDDDSDTGTPIEMLKRRRVPVPLPKARPGTRHLLRRDHAQQDSNVITSTSQVLAQEEELPCPMCNVMFRSSVIQDHAANCEGPESMVTITCEICDKVFLQNKDFELHSNECIQRSNDF